MGSASGFCVVAARLSQKGMAKEIYLSLTRKRRKEIKVGFEDAHEKLIPVTHAENELTVNFSGSIDDIICEVKVNRRQLIY